MTVELVAPIRISRLSVRDTRVRRKRTLTFRLMTSYGYGRVTDTVRGYVSRARACAYLCPPNPDVFRVSEIPSTRLVYFVSANRTRVDCAQVWKSIRRRRVCLIIHRAPCTRWRYLGRVVACSPISGQRMPSGLQLRGVRVRAHGFENDTSNAVRVLSSKTVYGYPGKIRDVFSETFVADDGTGKRRIASYVAESYSPRGFIFNSRRVLLTQYTEWSQWRYIT